MKSPFPGMDPYIESQDLWGDFRSHLLFEIRKAISDTLPMRYFARVAARSYVTLADSESQIIFPTPPHVARATASASAVADDGSQRMRAFVQEEHREPFLTIYCEDDPEPRVVTRIEILSPSNKRLGTLGWKLYQRQWRMVLRSNVHLVEIDLLRGGQRPPMLDPWPESPYTLESVPEGQTGMSGPPEKAGFSGADIPVCHPSGTDSYASKELPSLSRVASLLSACLACHSRADHETGCGSFARSSTNDRHGLQGIALWTIARLQQTFATAANLRGANVGRKSHS